MDRKPTKFRYNNTFGSHEEASFVKTKVQENSSRTLFCRGIDSVVD